MKPISHKNYGSIPHLTGSRIGQTDRYVPEGQNKIATEKTRDNFDTVIITEKIDGCNCGIFRDKDTIYPITRKGNLACQSPFPQHQLFYKWAIERYNKFIELLRPGERLIGEWLALVHGTKITILSNEEVFRAFDLMQGHKRLSYYNFTDRVAGKFQTVPLISYGPPRKPEWILDNFPVSGCGSEQVEGWVWRVERYDKFDFIAKWVRPDYEPGKYLPERTSKEPVWNWRPSYVK